MGSSSRKSSGEKLREFFMPWLLGLIFFYLLDIGMFVFRMEFPKFPSSTLNPPVFWFMLIVVPVLVFFMALLDWVFRYAVNGHEVHIQESGPAGRGNGTVINIPGYQKKSQSISGRKYRYFSVMYYVLFAIDVLVLFFSYPGFGGE